LYLEFLLADESAAPVHLRRPTLCGDLVETHQETGHGDVGLGQEELSRRGAPVLQRRSVPLGATLLLLLPVPVFLGGRRLHLAEGRGPGEPRTVGGHYGNRRQLRPPSCNRMIITSTYLLFILTDLDGGMWGC
jgi:hypothetical protein